MADRPRRVMELSQVGVLLVFILYNLHLQSCSAKKTCTGNMKPHSKGLCGKFLPEMLSLICGGQYRERGDMMKRSAAPEQNILDMDSKEFLDLAKSGDTDRDEIQSPFSSALSPMKQSPLNDSPLAQSPFAQSALGNQLFGKRQAAMFLQKKAGYYFTGVSCECCYHLCAMTELVLYCKDPKAAYALMQYAGMPDMFN